MAISACWNLVTRSIRGWRADNASSMGAALAFYTLFSLAPLLLVAVAVAGFFVGRSEAQDVLLAELSRMMGANAAAGVESLLEAAGSREEGLVPALIGFGTLAFGATRVFAELREDLDRIWRVPTDEARGIWRFVTTRLLSFGMVAAIGFLLLVSLAASAALTALGDYLPGSADGMVHSLEFGVSFVGVMLLFAMIYKFLPSTRIAWRDVWVGAAVTSLLFWLGKTAIGLYLGRTALASSFGAAGTLVVVIAWVYYSTLIFFLGAEFTREYAHSHGSKQGEPLERRRAQAANDEDIVDRARAIARGSDPILTRTTSTP